MGADEQELEVDFGEDYVLMLTINRMYEIRGALGASEFAWRLDVDRAKRADYVLAVVRGVVMDVIEVSRSDWKRATRENFPEKGEHRPDLWGHRGRPVEDLAIRRRYVGRRLPAQFTGTQNAVRYSYTINRDGSVRSLI